MKALLICSLHTLFDATEMELEACHCAFSRNKLPSLWQRRILEDIHESEHIIQTLNRLQSAALVSKKLVEDYLEILDDIIWSAPSNCYQSLKSILFNTMMEKVQRGFVSEYPLLTTNLARSAALGTEATRLGDICVATDSNGRTSTRKGLQLLAQSMGAAPEDCRVIVSSRQDYRAAKSLGMMPEFLSEVSVRNVSVPHQEKYANVPYTRLSELTDLQPKTLDMLMTA